MEDLCCIELRYIEKLIEPAGELCMIRAKTGILVASSTILREHKLQRVVSEMCFRLGWKPLVYRRIVEDQKPSIRNRHVLHVLS